MIDIATGHNQNFVKIVMRAAGFPRCLPCFISGGDDLVGAARGPSMGFAHDTSSACVMIA